MPLSAFKHGASPVALLHVLSHHRVKLHRTCGIVDRRLRFIVFASKYVSALAIKVPIWRQLCS